MVLYEILSEQILPVDFTLYEDNHIVHLKNEESFICLDAESRPTNWSLGAMDLFLGNEMHKGEFVTSDYLIHVGVHILQNQTTSRAGAIAKRETIEKNIKAGMGKFFPDLIDSSCVAKRRQDAAYPYEYILKGPQHKVSQAAKNYASMMRRNGWGFVGARYDHLATMLGSMPMGLVEEERGTFGKRLAGVGMALQNIGRGKKTVSSKSKALLSIVGEWKGDLILLDYF